MSAKKEFMSIKRRRRWEMDDRLNWEERVEQMRQRGGWFDD